MVGLTSCFLFLITFDFESLFSLRKWKSGCNAAYTVQLISLRRFVDNYWFFEYKNIQADLGLFKICAKWSVLC